MTLRERDDLERLLIDLEGLERLLIDLERLRLGQKIGGNLRLLNDLEDLELLTERGARLSQENKNSERVFSERLDREERLDLGVRTLMGIILERMNLGKDNLRLLTEEDLRRKKKFNRSASWFIAKRLIFLDLEERLIDLLGLVPHLAVLLDLVPHLTVLLERLDDPMKCLAILSDSSSKYLLELGLIQELGRTQKFLRTEERLLLLIQLKRNSAAASYLQDDGRTHERLLLLVQLKNSAASTFFGALTLFDLFDLWDLLGLRELMKRINIAATLFPKSLRLLRLELLFLINFLDFLVDFLDFLSTDLRVGLVSARRLSHPQERETWPEYLREN